MAVCGIKKESVLTFFWRGHSLKWFYFWKRQTNLKNNLNQWHKIKVIKVWNGVWFLTLFLLELNTTTTWEILFFCWVQRRDVISLSIGCCFLFLGIFSKKLTWHHTALISTSSDTVAHLKESFSKLGPQLNPESVTLKWFLRLSVLLEVTSPLSLSLPGCFSAVLLLLCCSSTFCFISLHASVCKR